MSRPQRHHARAIALAIGGLGALAACQSTEPPLSAPRAIVAPYDADTGDVLWAVAPLRNESGTSHADALSITDAVITAAEETRGVRAVPLARTLEAMHALGLEAVRSPQDAMRLGQRLNVDAVVVGSVKSYDPYTPSMGMALALYGRSARAGAEAPQGLDPRALTASPVDRANPTTVFSQSPAATASENLDAKNHDVLMELRRFAHGRAPMDSGLGWERYTRSMALYTEFVAYAMVDRLVQSEWMRVTGRELASAREPDASPCEPGGGTR